jgi:hypothetical protein
MIFCKPVQLLAYAYGTDMKSRSQPSFMEPILSAEGITRGMGLRVNNENTKHTTAYI